MCELGCENLNCSIFVLLSVPKLFLPLSKEVLYFNKAGEILELYLNVVLFIFV